MTKPEVGYVEKGGLKWYSFWIKAYDAKEGLVWEGLLYGRTETRKDGIKMLRVHNNTVPQELQDVFAKYGSLRIEWEPAWEEVEMKQLTENNEETQS